MDKELEKLEKKFSEWYDSRPTGMPPASWESWLAGYEAAKKELEK